MTQTPILGEPLPVELMNTVWAGRDGVHDSLADTDDAMAWLTAVAPRVASLADSDLSPVSARDAATTTRALRQLRDALRRLAADATDDDRTAALVAGQRDPQAAIDAVNAASAAAPRWATIHQDPSGQLTKHVESARDGVTVAIAEIAEEAMALFTGPDRATLRACYGPGCVLYFVKQHPRREWCSAGCGNRARVARHYRRHAQMANNNVQQRRQ